MNFEIVPGILEHEQPILQRKFKVATTFAQIIQIDIIDKKFADQTVIPDLSFTKEYDTDLELHLMTENPEDWIDSYQGLHIKRVAGHIEHMSNAAKFISKAREQSIQPYLALDLDTQVDTAVENLITKGCAGILIMTVKAGKSGQKFEKAALEKVSLLRKKFADLNIEIDGGVTEQIIPQALEAGVNIFAATSAIFQNGTPSNNYQALKSLLPTERESEAEQNT